eukprot:gene5380-biopygen8728
MSSYLVFVFGESQWTRQAPVQQLEPRLERVLVHLMTEEVSQLRLQRRGVVVRVEVAHQRETCAPPPAPVPAQGWMLADGGHKVECEETDASRTRPQLFLPELPILVPKSAGPPLPSPSPQIVTLWLLDLHRNP